MDRMSTLQKTGPTKPNAPLRNDANASHTSSDTPRKVSIVVPCFNEELSLNQLMERLTRLQETLGPIVDCQFILVDDGSSDDTLSGLNLHFADRPNFRIVSHAENLGISAAIRTGIEAANTEVVCTIDSDCSYDPLQLEEMIPALEENVDLVTASPYHPDGQVLNVPPWRLLISQMASRMYRWALRENLYTYTSCLRVYRRSTFRGLPFTENGFVGVAEVIWRHDQAGAKIVEHPAVLDVRQFGQSKMRVAQVTRDHLKLLCRIFAWRCGSLLGFGKTSVSTPTKSASTA